MHDYKIIFSRHAKRRIKLFNISSGDVEKLLNNTLLKEGKQEIVQSLKGYYYPIKIVVIKENETITVITAYPLKKRRKE